MQINLCKLIGHRWRFKDYNNAMTQNGGHYDYKRSRKCQRCHKREVTNDHVHWHEEDPLRMLLSNAS